MGDDDSPRMPIFVKVDEYKNVLEVMGAIKTRLYEGRRLLNKIMELKEEENKELEQWESTVEEIEGKIASLDAALAEPNI